MLNQQDQPQTATTVFRFSKDQFGRLMSLIKESPYLGKDRYGITASYVSWTLKNFDPRWIAKHEIIQREVRSRLKQDIRKSFQQKYEGIRDNRGQVAHRDVIDVLRRLENRWVILQQMETIFYDFTYEMVNGKTECEVIQEVFYLTQIYYELLPELPKLPPIDKVKEYLEEIYGQWPQKIYLRQNRLSDGFEDCFFQSQKLE